MFASKLWINFFQVESQLFAPLIFRNFVVYFKTLSIVMNFMATSLFMNGYKQFVHLHWYHNFCKLDKRTCITSRSLSRIFRMCSKNIDMVYSTLYSTYYLCWAPFISNKILFKIMLLVILCLLTLNKMKILSNSYHQYAFRYNKK